LASYIDIKANVSDAIIPTMKIHAKQPWTIKQYYSLVCYCIQILELRLDLIKSPLYNKNNQMGSKYLQFCLKLTMNANSSYIIQNHNFFITPKHEKRFLNVTVFLTLNPTLLSRQACQSAFISFKGTRSWGLERITINMHC
jgi:hypothetical protein